MTSVNARARFRAMRWHTCAVFAVAMTVASITSLAAGESRSLTIDAAQVTVIEEVEIPALEAGMLASVTVTEGKAVNVGHVLATIDDTEAQLAVERAKIELAIASEQAMSDIDVRAAQKTYDVAHSEFTRAEESRRRVLKSVNDTEFDRLRLAADNAELEIERAKRDAVIAAFTEKLKQNELLFAKRTLQRRQIASPTAGVVVEINKRAGEWVEPGDVVARVIRMDRLKVEAFVNVADLSDDILDAPVSLAVELPGGQKATYTGRVVFVSPEVNPVNSQVHFWAEVENTDGRLRPGLRGVLTIAPGSARATTNTPVDRAKTEQR